jgi:ketosteroid isomerase-like protein
VKWFRKRGKRADVGQPLPGSVTIRAKRGLFRLLRSEDSGKIWTMPTSKKVPFLLASALLSLTLATSFAASQQKSDAASKILALESKWNEAYKQGNVATMNSLLADDFIITVEDGSTFSKAGYIAHSGDSDNKVLISEMSDLKVRVHGDTAIVTGAYHEKGTTNGKPYEYHDRLTDVWMLMSDGRWQVIASHYAIPVK